MGSAFPPSLPYALVVDDEVLIRMDAASILEDAGFEVIEARHAEEAFALLQVHHARITLLFSDVHMPGFYDGFALARHTAAHWPHIAIVLASGWVNPGLSDVPEKAQFVSKPFSAAIVRRHLRRVLSGQQQLGPL